MSEFHLPYRYVQQSRGNTRDYVFYSAIDPSESRLRRKRIYLDHIRDLGYLKRSRLRASATV